MTAEEVSPGRYDDLSHRIKEMLQKGLPEHKHEADALYKSEEGYRLLAASVDSMYLVDSECRYLFMNEGYRRRFGLPLEDIIGRRYGDFHSEEDSRNFAEKVKEVIETGKATYQERWSKRDGRYFLRSFSPAMEHRPSGEVTEVVVVSKEITERKQAEEAIRALNVELQDRLQELTVARVLEEKANRAKTEFLANISHELTTPLNSIIGFSQVLLTKKFGDLNEKQRGYLENILHSGERLHKTLENIVSFVCMDVSNPEMDWEDFRLKDIVDSSLSVFRKAAADRHLTLTSTWQKKRTGANLPRCFTTSSPTP